MAVHIAHLSDLHFCQKHLAQVDSCMAHAIDVAREHRVDLAVVTGDSTDHALDAHAPAFLALARRVKELADLCPVLLLQGTYSHEPPGLLRALQLLAARHPIHVADRLCQLGWHRERGWIESDGWRFDELPEADCVFSCLPTVNKAEVAATVGAAGAAEKIGETVFALLSGLGVVNQRLRERGIPTALLGHGTVAGCVTEHEVPMAGLDHEFGLGSLGASAASAVMLGHIHKHQSWRIEHSTIAYAGSIARLHFGERGDKGLLVWDVGPEGAEFTFHPTPARRTIELDFEGLPDFEAIEAMSDAARGVSVRVRYSVAEEESAQVDRARILEALKHAAEVKIEGRVISVVRSRAQGIGAAQTLEERVARYAETAGIDAVALGERLALLAGADPETVARQVIARTTGRTDSVDAASKDAMLAETQPGVISRDEPSCRTN
jgi:exonuclease SbcD